MVIVRLKVAIQPDKIDDALETFAAVVGPSREVDGVISFDIARDLVDPNAIVAIEVYEDRAALDRQEELPIVQKTIGMLGDLVAGPPEATIYTVSSSEPWG